MKRVRLEEEVASLAKRKGGKLKGKKLRERERERERESKNFLGLSIARICLVKWFRFFYNIEKAGSQEIIDF